MQAEAGQTETSGTLRLALVVVGLGLLMRLTIAASIPLLEAEAYYWEWSRRLSWGYRDHPPMIAALIAATTAVFGHGAFAIRLGPLLLGTLGSWLLFRFSSRVAGARAGLICLVLATIAPFWFPFGVLALPDAPLAFFWILSLTSFLAAYDRGTWPSWLLAGAAVGLTILSKYNGFQLLGVCFLFLVLTPKGRRMLRGPWPWAGVVTALLVAAPNLLWNTNNGASTASIPFRAGLEFGAAFKHLGQLLLLPLVLLTPVLAVAWVRESIAAFRARRDDPAFVLAAAASWVPFGAFAIVSVATGIHLHWLATAMIGAAPIALRNWGGGAAAPAPSSPRVLRWGMGVAAVLFAGVCAAPFVAFVIAEPPKGREKPSPATVLATDFEAWDALRERLRAELSDESFQPAFLATHNFHVAGLVAWCADGALPVQPVREKSLGQYAWWRDAAEFRGQDALYVGKGRRGVPKRLHERFEEIEVIKPVVIPFRDGRVRRFMLFRCRGFIGIEPDTRGSLLVHQPEQGGPR